MRTARLAATLLPITLLIAGCGGKEPDTGEPPADIETIDEEDISVEARGIASYVEPSVYEKQFGLHARGIPGRIFLSVHNQSEEPVAVTIRDLALIMSPSERRPRLLSAGLVSEGAFQFRELSPGEHTLINIPFSNPSFNASGMRLVYNNPRQEILFFVDVQ